MREENLNRLSSIKIPTSNPNYLVYKSFHTDLFDCLSKYSRGKLLDIGCGNKPYLEVVTPFIDEYIGCDIIQSSKQNVDILCEATNIPLPGESFDTILSTQTIEHVAEYQLLVNEAFRLLKGNGYFILSGPMYWPLHEEPYDFFRFTKYGFRHILEKAGFSVIEEKTNGGSWALCGQVLIHTLLSNNINKSYFMRIIRKLMYLGWIRLINLIFGYLDKKYLNNSNTMNYVMIGKKVIS